jgi:hypothetical protein
MRLRNEFGMLRTPPKAVPNGAAEIGQPLRQADDPGSRSPDDEEPN